MASANDYEGKSLSCRVDKSERDSGKEYNFSLRETKLPAVISTSPSDDSSEIPLTAVITATITTGVKDIAGNNMQSSYKWSFRTELNEAPKVNAGADQNINVGAVASLDGAVTDDGLPRGGTLTTLWTQLSGSGTVSFGNAGVVDTTASFSASGVYVLELKADDGGLTATDTVTINVNAAPVADAGPGQNINLGETVSLDGTVADDGLPIPPGALTTTWTQLSGPGIASFGNASAVDTTASFSLSGVYELELKADDGTLITSDTVTISVNPVIR